jgi:Putative beta-barrel porin-2, OmpL-like. bbp2
MRRLVALLVCMAAVPAAAQDAPAPAGGMRLSGYVNPYYAFNFNRPATPCEVVNGVAVFNCLHAFDVAHNSFSLNLAAIGVEKAPTEDSRGGFLIDLGYGSGVALADGSAPSRPDRLENVQQAYVSYLLAGARRLQVDFGKFVTPAGIERMDPEGNWNASRSLLFALAIPRDHVGVRVAYAPYGWMAVTGLFSDGWNDVVEASGTGRIGVSVSLRPARAVSVTETYLGGSETSDDGEGWRDLSDTAISARVTGALALAFNADFGRDRRTFQSWQGAAAYARYEVRHWFAIASRIESLRDHSGFMSGVSQDLQEATATVEFRRTRSIVFRLEYRVDVADQEYFLRGVSTTVRTQSIVAADWVFSFDSHGPSRPDQTGLVSALRKK